MPTVAELDVQINAKDDATGTIAALDALIKSLDKDRVEITVDADAARAEEEIAALEAQINAISDETVTIEVDADGEGRIATLEAEIMALKDKTLHIKAEVDDRQVKRATVNLGKLDNQALNASRQIGWLATAVLGLGTALIPIGAVGVGGVAALTSAFTVAGVGVGLFGAVAVSAIKPVSAALKKMTTLQQQFNTAVTDKQRDAALAKIDALLKSLTPEQRALVAEVNRFQGAWHQLVSEFQPQVFQIATEGMHGLTSILDSLKPIIAGTAGAFLFLERAATRGLAGPFWQSFIHDVGQNVGTIVREMGLAFGNFISGFAAVVGAFLPLTVDFTGGLLHMSQRFKAWAEGLKENKGFQEFVQYIRDNTPKVLGLIGALADAFVGLVKAGTPVGERLVDGATMLFKWVDAFEEMHPKAFTAALAIIGFTAVAVNLIGPIVTVVRFLFLLTRGFGFLYTGLSALAGLLGVSVGLFLGVVGVVAALAYGIYYAYTHFKTFHDMVDAAGRQLKAWGAQAYEAIVGGLRTALGWLTTTFGPAVQAVIDFVVEQFNKVRDWASENGGTFAAAWDNIASVVTRIVAILWHEITGALSQIGTVWNFFWPTLSGVVMGVWTAIKGIISGVLDIIMGILLVFAGLFSGEWGKMWDGVVQILTGVWEIIKGIVQGGAQAVQALVNAGLALLAGIFIAGWGLVIGGVSAAFGTIKSIIGAAWGWIKTAFTTSQQTIQAGVDGFWRGVRAAFTGALGLIVGGLQAAMGTLIAAAVGGWNGIKAAFSGAQHGIQAGIDGFWSGVRRAFTSGIGLVRDGLSAALNTMVGIVTGIAGRFYSAGASLMKSLASGIASGIGNTVGAVRSAVGQLTDLLPGSPAKVGPLSGQGYALIRGQHFSEDLAAGIMGRAGLVKDASRFLADAIGQSTAPAALTAGPSAFGPSSDGPGGVSISVAAGAVVLQLAAGVDPKAAAEAFDGASDTIADGLLTAIRRR